MHNLMKRDGSLESMEDKSIVPPDPTLEADERTFSPTCVQDVEDDHVAAKHSVVGWFKQLVDSEARNSSNPFQTPSKSASQESCLETPTSPLSNATPTRHPMSSSPVPTSSPFRKHSKAIGAGWNAKGLQKATKQDWEGALLCWENALEIRVQVVGEDHKDVANTRNNLGIALGRLGREDAAMGHLEKALEIRTKLYGKDHADVAATLHNVGNVLQQKGDYEGALKSFTEAKRIQQEIMGENSIQVARAWNAIGHLHFESLKHKEAYDAFRHALQTFYKAGRDEKHDVEVQHTKMDLEEVEQLLP